MKLKKHIPNILTGFNLLSGLISITMVLQGSFVLASVFIFVAGGF